MIEMFLVSRAPIFEAPGVTYHGTHGPGPFALCTSRDTAEIAVGVLWDEDPEQAVDVVAMVPEVAGRRPVFRGEREDWDDLDRGPKWEPELRRAKDRQ